MRSNLLVFLFLFSFIRAEFRSADAFVAEATEIIGVVRLGVSLVEYIYKVFSHVFEDSGLSDADLTGKRLPEKICNRENL